MLYDDSTATKVRFQRLRSMGRPAAVGAAVFVLMLSLAYYGQAFGDQHSVPAPRLLADMRSRTADLGARVQELTLSVASLAREINAVAEEREKRKTRLEQVASLAKEEASSVRQHVEEAVAELRKAHEKDMKELQEKLNTMQAECGTHPQVERQTLYTPSPEQSELVSELIPPTVDPCKDEDEDDVACRKGKVKAAFLHSWKGYKKYAWGHDELLPLSKRWKDWGPGTGLGLSMMDAISTMWMMDLKDEFHEVRKWVKEKLDLKQDYSISAFEATIRMVGSMLSAYEISGEKYPEFLRVAEQVAQRVLWAYNTSSGIPHATVNFASHQHSNPQWTGGSSVLSEFGTVQLEMRTLSYHTKDSVYDEKATWIMDIIQGKAPPDMLCPTYYNSLYNRWTSDHITLGALGDSFYEYLLKQYLLTGKKEEKYKLMYLKAVRGIVDKLVMKSTPGGHTYVAEFKRGAIFNKMDHLACFTGGMLALGTATVIDEGYTEEEKKRHLLIAEELAETCYQMYKSQPTGIAPEIVEFRGGGDMTVAPKSSYYLLRPEAVETFMYLWRFTKKQKYRDWAWDVFLHIEQWCKVEGGGYCGLRNVGFVPPQKDDLQQSFWFAETLKYLYVIFSEDDLIDFDEWVLNTEAHPMKVRERNPRDLWSEATRRRWEQEQELPIDERLRKYQEEFEKRVMAEGREAQGLYGGQEQQTQQGALQQQAQQATLQQQQQQDSNAWLAEQERLVRESRERHQQWQREQDQKYREAVLTQQQQQQSTDSQSDQQRLDRLQHQARP